MPPLRAGLLGALTHEAQIDSYTFDAFGLKDSERVLVEDLFFYTLLDFQGNDSSPGRQRTVRSASGVQEPQLTAYCEYFIRVLKAGFGRDKAVKATIFHDSLARMPFRLIAFELGRAADKQIVVGDSRVTGSPGRVRTARLHWICSGGTRRSMTQGLSGDEFAACGVQQCARSCLPGIGYGLDP